MKLIDKLKTPTVLPDGKSRLTYAVLATFFGGLGLHNFYAGNSEKAKAQLKVGLIGLCCCCQPLYLLSVISALVDVITVTACAILNAGVSQTVAAPRNEPALAKPKDATAKKPFPVKLVVIAALILFIGLPIVVGIVVTVVGVTGGLAATSVVEKMFDSDYEKWVADDRNPSDVRQTEKAERRETKSSKSATSTRDMKNLTPDQKVDRLMAQLRKVLGNSGLVTVALATVQEKADQCQGDYKTKCVLMEMMGLQNKISGGVVPDLPDPNGNGVLEKYLKEREIDGIGTIMCMYHMLSDEEQKSVADEVRKLMK